MIDPFFTNRNIVHISQFLDTNGDGTGTINAIGNYSGAAEDFYIQPPEGRTYFIYRMIVHVEDTAGFRADRYGNLAGALANGIEVLVEYDGTTVEKLTQPGAKIVNNGDWAMYCYDAQVYSWGAGDEMLGARWTFSRSGVPVYLNSADAARLVVRLNDDFTGLVFHKFLAQGYERIS